LIFRQDIAEKLERSFVDDARLSSAILLLVGAVVVLLRLLKMDPLDAGSILIVGSLTIFLVSVVLSAVFNDR